MSIIRRKSIGEEPFSMIELTPTEQANPIDSWRMIEIVAALRNGPSFCGSVHYRDSSGRMVYQRAPEDPVREGGDG